MSGTGHVFASTSNIQLLAPYFSGAAAGSFSRGLEAVRIVLLGPPGAGKGTQANLLSNHFAIPHISTGNILRAAAANVTPMGAKLRDVMGRGELVPDKVILEIIGDRIRQDDTEPGFILDGFPRNEAQARALDMLMMEGGELINAAIELRIEEAKLMARINGRVAEMASRGEGVRLDDTADSLRRRLAIYRAETAPLINYYHNCGLLRIVDGTLPIDKVTQQIHAALSGSWASSRDPNLGSLSSKR